MRKKGSFYETPCVYIYFLFFKNEDLLTAAGYIVFTDCKYWPNYTTCCSL